MRKCVLLTSIGKKRRIGNPEAPRGMTVLGKIVNAYLVLCMMGCKFGITLGPLVLSKVLKSFQSSISNALADDSEKGVTILEFPFGSKPIVAPRLSSSGRFPSL